MRCVSYHTTKKFHLSAIASFFRSAGHEVKQYLQVLHITTASAKEHDIFIFICGCFVTWGLSFKEEKQLLEQLKPFFIKPLPTIETNKFIYRYAEQVEIKIHGRFNCNIISIDSENIQLKLAISYALAQSLQLQSFEMSLQETIDKNSNYPKELAKKGTISLSSKEISKLKGQIFIARSNINLNSEYISTPEYFREHSSFENHYDKTKKFLDINKRVSALNQKLTVLRELFEMLTDQQQYKQSRILQGIIILLVIVELVASLLTK